MWCAADTNNYMCYICAKGFLDSYFTEAVIDKISNFQEIAPDFTYSQKHNFYMYNWNSLDQLRFSYKFYGRNM